MGVDISLYVYILIVIIISFILCKINIPAFYAITMGLISGWLYLIIYNANTATINLTGSSYALYLFILIGTIIYLVIFAILVTIYSSGSKKTIMRITSPRKNIRMVLD